MLRTISHIFRPASILVLFGIFSLPVWSAPADSPAPAKEVSVQEYVAQLRAASTVLDGDDAVAIHNFRWTLPSEWVVRTEGGSGGQLLAVKTDWLGATLLAKETSPKGSAEQVREGQQHLAALLKAAEDLQSPRPRPDLAQSHAQIDRILRDREFQGSHEASWLDKLQARVRQWISENLDKLFDRMGVSASVGSAIAWTLVTVVALLLAFWAVRYVIAAAARSEMDLSGAVPAGQDWRYWAREARAAAERGDYRAAIHAAYWTAVTQLEENHVFPEDRSRTPRELLRMVKRDSAAHGPLAQLTRRFEVTWYGYHVATSSDWDDVRKHMETLECLRSSTHATANS
jgi:Domain of unknown function (DUF4129)